MAELRPGPLGSIKGKVGNVVASNWRDIQYVRGLSKRSNKGPSTPQKITQARFKLMTGFLSKIKSVVDLGFGYRYTGRATAYNLAVQQNMTAIGGLYPDLEIDYPSIVLSAGSLISCSNLKAKSDMPETLEVSWVDLGDKSEQYANDKVIAVIYNPEKKQSLVNQTGALREDYNLVLTVPRAWSGDELHGYLFFHNETLKKNSETVYFGPVSTM